MTFDPDLTHKQEIKNRTKTMSAHEDEEENNSNKSDKPLEAKETKAKNSDVTLLFTKQHKI